MSNTSDQTTQQSKTRLIIGEIGVDTETGIIGKGHSYDNGKTFTVDDTIYGRIYHADDHGKIWKGIQDQVAKVVAPAKSAADSAVSAADAAVASAQVTSATVSAIASATAEAKQGANEAMSRALSAWDVATGAKKAVTDFDPLLKSAQSDASQAIAQIADTATALSNAKTELGSDVAAAKELANTAQTTANSAVESASENARELASQANALSDARKAMDSGVASATGLANAAQSTADTAIKSASSVANDLATVASQAKANASGITKVTSDVGLLQTTVADNSGNISKIQETAVQLQQAVSDNSGAIVTATQTAQSATTVASDAKSNATVAVQTASGASVMAKNAQGDATTAITTAQSAVTQASDAKSNATIAVQTASEASVTATNAQGDASIAKQTASDASVQIKNAQGDISALQTRAGKIEASVATNSGAIANVQVTANQLKASVSDNAGNITTAKQTADSAVTVASDARSNATVAIQTASQASITANNASGQAASAVVTANGALTTASDAKSDATVAVQTASGASLTATNAQGDATIAKQTASEATVQASNAESDFAQLSIRANKIEANVATNSGAIASVQQTANGLTTTVADIKANGGGVNLVGNSEAEFSGKAYEFHGYSLASSNALTPGTTYTMSFSAKVDYKAVNCNQSIFVYIYNPSWKYVTHADVPISTDYQRIVYTFTVPKGITDANGISAYLSHPVINGNRDSSSDKSDVAGTGYIKELMIEEGTIAHSWSPAPDDLQAQFTQIKQSVDGVETTINDPTTGLNVTYQTAQGNASTISNVKGDVTQLQTTANGLTSRVGDLESKTDTQQTAIEQNKSAIALKADQTTVDTLKGTVSQNTATLKTQADQIQSKVSASDVTGMLNGYATQNYAQSLVTQTADKWNLNLTELKTDVNAIKTTGGGVNLLSGTKDFSGFTTGSGFWVQDTSVTSPNGQTAVYKRTGAWNGLSQPIKVQSGTTYTFSAWVKVSNYTEGKDKLHLYWNNHTGTVVFNADVVFSNLSNDTWMHIIKTATAVGTGTAIPRFESETGTMTIWVTAYMLEEGTVAHTWAPAPSDLATVTSVANLSATVDGIQSQVYNADGSSIITQLSNLIQSKVGTDDFNNLKQAVDLQTIDSADINNMKTNGHYFVHNLANNPVGGWVYVDVTGDGSTRIRQDVYQDNGTKHKYRRWVNTNWTDWEEGATYTEINQLQDAINLRVTKGDLISQINLQAGASLIQSDKLVLDANTTIVTGNAFIPSAAIESLDASKLTFYGANGTYATMGASVAQYDDDKQKSTINLQYNGGIEIHSSNQQGSILTMHDNTIRLASKSWGDNSNPYQYSGFYAAPNYSLMNTYHKDGTTSGVAIDDSQIHIYGNSKDQQLGSLQADVGWYILNGKTGSLVGDQISLKAGNTQAVLTNNNINISNPSDTNDKNYDVAIHIKGWAEMTGWFTCMGITQTSLLSTKTRIEPLDTKAALDKIASTNVETYQFKSDVANGKTKRHASVIIDDVHDVAEYYTPEEFISENRMGRDDGDIIGYLMGAVQELKKQLDELKEKI